MNTALDHMGRQAKLAARRLAGLERATKDQALLAIADALLEQQAAILAANEADVATARANGTGAALLDRMLLTPERLAAIAADTRSVAELPDPVGEVFDQTSLPNGLRLHKRRTPLGVVGVIYEARPNVTVDIAALCLKTSNAVILRGGSDIAQSVAAITTAIQAALQRVGLPTEAVQSITDPDRAVVGALLRLDQYVDMIIPRGGAGLHRFCIEQSTIPVITGGLGVVHIYVDATADLERAVPLIFNAKVQRPSVCNALDTLLVQHEAAPRLLPAVVRELCAAGVELRCDPASLALLADQPEAAAWTMRPAEPDDFGTEFLGLVLSLKLVANLDEALEHIATYSTGHTDAILTSDAAAAQRFIQAVDSGAVLVNASTRFNDGGQFGLGAEVAISTQKLHARGPMGLRELTTYKWVGEADYVVRPG
ncbi:glutamate-5-semialdehyde dehydrogenase [Candidatus Viridilinea mediisalina]|uniref:Gamma-glutamyl phosphate reductase n=1 Tax=Candidatus Viridilinea mediisalina TaxID=2024553 RepID=A0A2A6RF09_9CHLR|nr:glutamate-5-semialdehyde dehydrogenase [Candidatus Viridilinea mediisalina]PDW01469.1 glutamate-5-semialdehyde dehydrogenase [Candidatus Viridilinea mediisalina]